MFLQVAAAEALGSFAVHADTVLRDQQPQRPDRLVPDQAVLFGLDLVEEALAGALRREPREGLRHVKSQPPRDRRVAERPPDLLERGIPERHERGANGVAPLARRQARDEARE